MYIDNGSIYFSNTYSLGGKIVYIFEISRLNEGSGENIPPEVSSKLSEIIGELNSGADQWGDEDFYETEDTYELTRGYK